MRDPDVHVADACTGRRGQGLRLTNEHVDPEAEDLRSLHIDLGRGLARRIRAGLDVADGDLVVTASVRAEAPARETGAGRSRAHDRRPCAVCEEHAHVPFLPVDHAAHDLGSHRENGIGGAAGDIGVGDGQRVEEARAGSEEIVGAGAVGTEQIARGPVLA